MLACCLPDILSIRQQQQRPLHKYQFPSGGIPARKGSFARNQMAAIGVFAGNSMPDRVTISHKTTAQDARKLKKC